MAISFEVVDIIPESPDVVYQAWLDSAEHTKMSGSPAEVSAEVGGGFSAWEGYISGKNLELEAGVRILQAWRTLEFETDDEDSLLEILFEGLDGGTQITLRHANLPAHGMQYQQGWVDSYFNPMKDYFATPRS